MRNLIILAAAAAAITAVPAAAQERAGEARAEVRGGVAWAGSVDKAFAGVAIGYDFDLGETAFLGIEGSADKVLANGANVLWSAGARVGARVGAQGRIYGLGGYGLTKGDDAGFIGAGYQQKFGSRVYGKVEYRRTLTSGTDVNFAGAGLGLTF